MVNLQNKILITASSLGILAVSVGAFGAHVLKPVLEETQRLDTFNTATEYHFYHTLLLIGIGLSSKFNNSYISYSALSIILGIFLFSGSLYILAAFDIPQLAIITPFGGLFFVVGWLLLGIGVYKSM